MNQWLFNCLNVFAGMLIFPQIVCAGSFTFDISAAGIPGTTPGISKALIVVDSNRDGFLGFGDVDRRDEDVRLFPLRPGVSIGDDLVLGVMTAFAFDSYVLFESGVREIDPEDPAWKNSLQPGDPIGLLNAYFSKFDQLDQVLLAY